MWENLIGRVNVGNLTVPVQAELWVTRRTHFRSPVTNGFTFGALLGLVRVASKLALQVRLNMLAFGVSAGARNVLLEVGI